MATSLLPNDDQNRRALEQKLVGWWTAALGISSIGMDDDVFRLGCDPERGAVVLGRVRHELQVEIPTSDLFEARTISKLADLIEIRQASMDALSIVPIRRGSHKQPLILVHGVGGNLLGFVALVRLLEPDQPVYGVQAQALHGTSPVLTQLESMAAFYVRELRKVQPNGPYAFLGLSFGGLVAYEMAQQLVASGEAVTLLGMLDTWQPGYMRQLASQVPLSTKVIHRLRMGLLNTRKLSARQTVRYTLGRLKARLVRAVYLRIREPQSLTLPGFMRHVRDINLSAGARYTVKPYPGKITLFRARDEHWATLPEDLGWRTFARDGVEVVALPGDHGQVLTEPNVSYLAEKLTSGFLNAAPGPEAAHTGLRIELRTEIELVDEEWIESAPLPQSCQPSLQEAQTAGEMTVLADHEIQTSIAQHGPLTTWLQDRRPPQAVGH